MAHSDKKQNENDRKDNIVVLGIPFPDAASRLPKDIQSKVTKVQAQFFKGPFANGLHQEKIEGVDTDIYSCRVDSDYRIIYKRPEGSKAVFFLYVVSAQQTGFFQKSELRPIELEGVSSFIPFPFQVPQLQV